MDSKKKSKIPRRISNIKPSKYEAAEAIHNNKAYWGKVLTELDNSGTSEVNQSSSLAKVLPDDLYRKVCSTLDIPVVTKASATTKGYEDEGPRRAIKEPMLSHRKCLHINRELESDTDVEFQSSGEDDADDKPNIYQEFLNKPEREQVTWPTRYLQPEKEDEKGLVRKADDLTDRIANEFCEYMTQLGGDQQSQLFTPKAIKELFQIEFDTHVARGLRVVTKELPTVEEKIANVVGKPEKSHHEALDREITRDIKAERSRDNVMAFSRSIPRRDQWRAPRNDTSNMWRSARHVPKDLVTLKTVWDGITNLRHSIRVVVVIKSVKEYCRWMIDHPEYRRAPYLSSLGMFDPAVLDARLTFESRYTVPLPMASPSEPPAPIEDIRKRLSQLADEIN